MKRKITALIAIVFTCLLCLPVFSGCKGKSEYTLKEDADGKYYCVNYSGFSGSLKGNLEIPAERDGIPVKEIAQEGFTGANITSLTIPASVEIIGNAAFAHCYRLSRVAFADGTRITEISRGMFGFCQALRSIEIPETVTEIGVAAFLHCEKLSEVSLPENLERIDDEAFEGCYELRQATFPDALGYIGERAYYNTGLTSVKIPDGVADRITVDGEGKETVERALGYGAFHTCLSLETAEVGAGITELPAGTFGACSALKEVKLTASLKRIEGAVEKGGRLYCGHAFFGCNGLENIYFSGSKAQWDALKARIENTPYKDGNVTYNNNPVLTAAVHYAL